MTHPVKTATVIFTRSFSLPGCDDRLPAGEYETETELQSPPDLLDPEAWKASVLVHLRPQASYPRLARTLTVSLADLDRARARDTLTGLELSQLILDELLADPMVQLVMQADGVSEGQLRHLYSRSRTPESDREGLDARLGIRAPRERTLDAASIQAAENEGMPTLAGAAALREPGDTHRFPAAKEHRHDQ